MNLCAIKLPHEEAKQGNLRKIGDEPGYTGNEREPVKVMQHISRSGGGRCG